MNTRSKEATLKSLVRKMELEIGEIARTRGVSESKFKQISGYDDYYISEDGVVVSTKCSRVKFLATGLHPRGYMRITLLDSRIKKRRVHFVHRIVAEAFVPKAEGMDIVNHLDGNKLNNNASNLEWTDMQGNTRHYFDMVKQSKRHITELKQAYTQYKNDPEQFMNFFAKTVMSK